ncbi:elongation factor P 5-aminopentanone reductase [Faecalimonas sp.]
MNKTNVLITGASRGIGKAIALLFAQKNFRVFINCSRSISDLEKVKQEIESMNTGECYIVTGDIGKPDDVKNIFAQIQNKCDGIDILINNAGISYIGLLTDMTIEEWNHLIQTNLSSAFYCSKEAIPHMVSQKSGKIIQISSIWGNVGASCEVAYSASKAGLHGFTKALAKELAPSNIQVNAIACGAIDTVMNAQLDAEERLVLEEEIPAGRFGKPEEVAKLVFDIANDHNYLTGQIIGLDGGW